jgi:hypothetical protein
VTEPETVKKVPLTELASLGRIESELSEGTSSPRESPDIEVLAAAW